MVDPDRQRLSPSIGDYLKAIWAVAGTGVASTKQVSEHLSVTPASVTNMFARLQQKGLIRYERHRGSSLTGRGRTEALRLVRRRRLIETFLIEHLGYSWEEVQEKTRRDGHLDSEKFMERLAELLGDPLYDPLGHPIPRADGTLPTDNSCRLDDATVGQRVRIRRVGNDSVLGLTYLRERGLVPGRVLEVTEIRTLDGIVAVRDEDGASHVLGGPLASSVFVQPVSELVHD